jgi:hypothetical protein
MSSMAQPEQRETRCSLDVNLAPALPIVELLRPAWYVGTIACVRACGTHKVLVLREACRDGRELTVWVSSVAIEAAESSRWRGLLNSPRIVSASVRFWGRFTGYNDAGRLTSDVHYPDRIWIDAASRVQQ